VVAFLTKKNSAYRFRVERYCLSKLTDYICYVTNRPLPNSKFCCTACSMISFISLNFTHERQHSGALYFLLFL